MKEAEGRHRVGKPSVVHEQGIKGRGSRVAASPLPKLELDNSFGISAPEGATHLFALKRGQEGGK